MATSGCSRDPVSPGRNVIPGYGVEIQRTGLASSGIQGWCSHIGQVGGVPPLSLLRHGHRTGAARRTARLADVLVVSGQGD